MTREEWKAHVAATIPRDANCLYCGIKTGRSSGYRPIFTVCNKCRYRDNRDESREVAAGMRVWGRPIPAFSISPHAIMMGDRDWEDALDAWTAEQADIARFNDEALGALWLK